MSNHPITFAMITAVPVTTWVDVRFAETDAMGVVHHGAYVIWFEIGRVAWMAAAGMPYAEVAASGHHFAVTGLHANYRTACRFGERVRLVTTLTKLRSRQVEFSYTLYNDGTDGLLATAATEHICVDLTGQMAKIPETVIERLQAGAVRLAAAMVPQG